MKKGLIITVSVLAGLLFIIGVSLISGYNSLVVADETVSVEYQTIEARLQERHDMIGQIVDSVSGLQEHEAEIYQMITDARAAYASAVASNDVEAMIEADALEANAMNQFLAVIEDNPSLIVGSGYQALIDSISSLESALFVARRDYNLTVADYNIMVRKFPKVIYASLFNFDKSKEYWKMNDGAEEVPVINFNE